MQLDSEPKQYPRPLMKIKYKLWWVEAAQIHRQTELIVFLLLQSAFPKRKSSAAETAYKPSWSGGSLLFHQEYVTPSGFPFHQLIPGAAFLAGCFGLPHKNTAPLQLLGTRNAVASHSFSLVSTPGCFYTGTTPEVAPNGDAGRQEAAPQMHSSREQGESAHSARAAGQQAAGIETCSGSQGRAHGALLADTHTNNNSSSSQGMLKVRKEFKMGKKKTGNWGMSRTAATSASALNSCRGACDRAWELRAGPAPRPVPVLLTPASSSPKSPDGALGTPRCSLAANQTHTPPITPALGRVSESRTLPSPAGSQSQLHGHYLLLRMQVSSLPSSS